MRDHKLREVLEKAGIIGTDIENCFIWTTLRYRKEQEENRMTVRMINALYEHLGLEFKSEQDLVVKKKKTLDDL